eukprot:1298160-Pyramimonas_sp.AAC.2
MVERHELFEEVSDAIHSACCGHHAFLSAAVHFVNHLYQTCPCNKSLIGTGYAPKGRSPDVGPSSLGGQPGLLPSFKPWSRLSTVGKKSIVRSTVMNQSRLLGRPSRPEVDCWVDPRVNVDCRA